MKKCNECGTEKEESEFYRDVRPGCTRREAKCKVCRRAQSKNSKINKIKIKYEIINDGYKECERCNQVKNIIEFQINRAVPSGRKKYCSICENLHVNTNRRKNGPIHKPPCISKLVPEKTEYKSALCEVCNSKFSTCRNNHKRCENCSNSVINIQRHISHMRNGKIIKIEEGISIVELSVKIAIKLFNSTNCRYCNRIYTKENNKQIDHILPICLGGTHSIDNIEICCMECNFSKNRYKLDDWIKLCKTLSCQNKTSFYDKTLYVKRTDLNNCEVCNNNLNSNHYSKKYCSNCVVVIKRLTSSLTSDRKEISSKCNRKIISEIAKKWVNADICIYCKRNFTKLNPKSPDHIVPVCKGGQNTYENINVSCLECNRTKSRLALDQWINLCILVDNNFI